MTRTMIHTRSLPVFPLAVRQALAGMAWLALVAVMIGGAGGVGMAGGGEGMRGPGIASARRVPLGSTGIIFKMDTDQEPTTGAGIFLGLLGFYRTVISPVDGDRCQMAPTCSLYSRLALRKYGMAMGLVLTADRLLHEADEIPQVPAVTIHGETFFLDPLSANTYWWE